MDIPAAEAPYVLCIDVGSYRNIGWATSDGAYGTGADLDSALDRVGVCARSTGRAAIGFEAPIWTPARSVLTTLTSARGGVEKKHNRAWSAGAGCGSLGTALVLMPYCFSRIHAVAGAIRATVNIDDFALDGGLLIWEAFVSGSMKVAGATHHDDARIACDAFARRWPVLTSDIPGEPATNHAVASAMAAGLTVDAAELRQPALVVGVEPRFGVDETPSPITATS
jgi:hypothetical protein